MVAPDAADLPDGGRYRALVVGASLGGVEALQVVLGSLRTRIGVPVLVAQHAGPGSRMLDKVLGATSRLPVTVAVDGEAAEPGRVYLCPPRGTLRLEPDGTLTARTHDREISSGSVDELFRSAADALGPAVLAIVLTGTGHDGLAGAQAVRGAGGTVLAQDEPTSLAYGMPGSVVAAGLADLELPLGEIPRLLDDALGAGLPLPLPGVPAAQAVFALGGEVGEAMARTDWAATPLGPVETWSSELLTVLAMILPNEMPLHVFWGPQHAQLYNDAAVPVIGDRHPASLGRPILEDYPEAAAQLLGPVVEATGAGRAVTYADQRVLLRFDGRLEEHFYTVCYSPLRERGRIAGTFANYIETTGQVRANRRLNLLDKLAAVPVDDEAGETAVAARLTAVLADNPADIAFALVYLPDSAGTELHLAGAAGPAPGAEMAPRRINGRVSSPWPVTAALRSGEPWQVDDLRSRFGTALPAAEDTAAAESVPDRALVLPAGRRDDDVPAAVVIAGINPLIPLDAEYRSFLALVADRIGAAVLAARRRADAAARIAALRELNRARTEFFTGVSHEFRTPLTLLLGPLEQLIEAGSDLRPEHADAARLAHRNALRLLKLVNTLLEFAQAEQGAVVPRFAYVDLAALTAGLVALFRSSFEAAGLTLDVDCPPLGRPLPVDPDMWERIVLNLLSNALKHTFTGGVTVTLRLQPKHAELTVTDTGVGIPEADQRNLFTRFHRVRGAKARGHEGSGLGLALVQQLVRLHRGSVRVRSRVGQGSTFTVWVPLAQPRAAAEHRPDPDVRKAYRQAVVDEAELWLAGAGRHSGIADAAPPPPGRRATVLLVDDNADLRGYVTRLLADRFEVIAVGDGKAALAELDTQRVDLVLTDVMMPELDGLELLHRIRSHERHRGTPVILLTAVAATDSTVAALSAGAHDYIVKPFTARELIARIEAQLALARGRSDRDAPTGTIQSAAVTNPSTAAQRTPDELARQAGDPDVI
ncbi:chemotaxis protein CheB [Nonomuraea sp. NPDC050783]|uniref:chemotaxis protein CheB n=1 Tax=Nonomuraea sp. NPDC050783 TaxID=3154634 RepID=UPI0034663077